MKFHQRLGESCDDKGAIWQADTYCDSCAEGIRADLRAKGKEPTSPEDETSYDSDDWPKRGVGEESDSPCHCGHCGIRLASCGITEEGVRYVVGLLREANVGDAEGPCLRLWAEEVKAYTLSPQDRREVARFLGEEEEEED